MATIKSIKDKPSPSITQVEIHGRFRSGREPLKGIKLSAKITPKTAPEEAVGTGIVFGEIRPALVRFLDNTNKEIDSQTQDILQSINRQLNVSNYETTKDLPKSSETVFGTRTTDVDNFRLEVKDPNIKVKRSVTVKLEVLHPPSISELPLADPKVTFTHSYTLKQKTGDTTIFRSDILRLVSDAVDDAASGDEPKKDPDKQTILVEIGDQIRVTYKTVGKPDEGQDPTDCQNEISVCSLPGSFKADEILTVDLDIRILFVDKDGDKKKDPGEAFVTDAEIRRQLAVARSIWAQTCIRIKVVNISDFELPAGVLNARDELIITDTSRRFGNPFAVGSGARKIIDLSRRRPNTITVYFGPKMPRVGNITFHAQAVNHLRMEVARRFDAIQGKRPGPGAIQRYANTIFITPTLPLLFDTLAHEIGHILTNLCDSPQPQQIVFPQLPLPTFDLRNIVSGLKRLPGQPDGQPHYERHLDIIQFRLKPDGGIKFIERRVFLRDISTLARRRINPKTNEQFTQSGNTVIHP